MPEAAREPAPYMSQTLRRSGRRGTRLLALLSLIAALAATGYVLATATEPPPPVPVEVATRDAWTSLRALSDGLSELKPGASRAGTQKLARSASTAVKRAAARVKAFDATQVAPPLQLTVSKGLAASAKWVDAVGSTLANPRSPRRAELGQLAGRAALGVSLVAMDIEDARDCIRGTGGLLRATRPG